MSKEVAAGADAAEVDFPDGTLFWDKDDSPWVRIPDGRFFNCFGGRFMPRSGPMGADAVEFATPISRTDFLALVDRTRLRLPRSQ